MAIDQRRSRSRPDIDLVEMYDQDTLPQASSSRSQTGTTSVHPFNRHGSFGQDDLEDDEMLDLEDVDISRHSIDRSSPTCDETELEFEEVDLVHASSSDNLQDLYAAAYQEQHPDQLPTSNPPIFKDGKGQPRGVEISMGNSSKLQAEDAAKKKSINFFTPKDRQNRITAHKLYLLAILSFARIRNKWCSDSNLRDHLANMVPDYMVTKLRTIHPKKVPEQRERIRMFESFLLDLVKWWSAKFRLDPHMTARSALRQPNLDIVSGVIPLPGRHIDGWQVESATERDQRHKHHRKLKLDQQKDKAKATDSLAKDAFKSFEITLLAPGTNIRPIFLSLLPPAESITCPADLLERSKQRSGSRETSAQLFCAMCRSLGIPARLVVSPQPVPWSVGASKLANICQPTVKSEKKPSNLPSRTNNRPFRTKPQDQFTSDDEQLYPSDSTLRPHSPVASNNSKLAKGKGKATVNPDPPNSQDATNDRRPEKWRNLKTPLYVEPKIRLRTHRPKQLKPTEVATDDGETDPVDLSTPPTMWVEVFSKPYQKWIAVDPIRAIIRPSGNRLMEPSPADRQNKLIYVVAFEEDGYGRDVTARYTKTLNSRVVRLRPPTRGKNEEDEWWTKVVTAIHRRQRLDRDAMEDIELNDNASREPMPTSVASFKDHPVYFLEKFLKRDEVVYPKTQIATFQGMPVFSRANVLSLRSARQWYNEGKVIKGAETPLKWVKSRGYTIANKRAEEQARSEGRDIPQEGLYADFQTTIYVPPPVVNGKIPTNHFGNIDLFVPSMLPAGAVHIPYSGAAKVAKKLQVSYAEAITGFEFRKQRGMPKITGIVIPKEYEEMLLDAYYEHEQIEMEKERIKKQERAIKAWRKLIHSVQIAKRVQQQYGNKLLDNQSVVVEEEEEGGGGFIVDQEEEESVRIQMIQNDDADQEEHPTRIQINQDEDDDDERFIINQENEQSKPPLNSKILSLSELASSSSSTKKIKKIILKRKSSPSSSSSNTNQSQKIRSLRLRK